MQARNPATQQSIEEFGRWRAEHGSTSDSATNFIVDSIPALIAYIDCDCRFRFSNHAYAKWFGLTSDEVIGRLMVDVIGDAAWKVLKPYVERALRGESVQFDTDIEYPNNRKCWIRAAYTPHWDDAGHVIGFSALVTDLSEHRDSSAQFEAIVASSSDAIMSMTLDGIITSWNASAERIYEYSAAEVIGQSILRLFPSDRHDEEAKILGRIRGGEALEHYETVRLTKSGRLLDVSLTVSPIKDRAGNVIGVSKISRDITERKLAEKALKRANEALAENERHLRFVTDHAPVLIVECDANRVFTFANAPYAARFGLQPKDIVGRRVDEVVGPAGYEKIAGHVEAALRGERRDFEVMIPYQFADRWMHCSYVPNVGIDGHVKGLVAVLQDVTSRRQVEQSLRESEERFRQLAENIPQLAWMANPDGWILWYNKRWFDYTGTTLQEMQGWGWQAVHHPDYVERVTKKFKAALASGESWEDTFPLRGKDGRFRWFLSRAFPIRDATGQINRWFGTNTDITDLRDVEYALAEREAVLRTVANHAGVGLIMVSKERRYLFANQTVMEIMGLQSREVIGKHIRDVIGDMYDTVEPRLQRAFGGEKVKYELHIARDPRTGQERFFDVRYEPRIENQSEPYVVIVFIDITERKKAQEYLEKTVAERTAALRESHEQMETFTYTIAHDLRAPLRSQQAFASALLEDYGEVLGSTGRDFAQRIIDSASRLNNLVSDLLDYSRLTRTQMTIEKIDLRALVLSICEEMEFQIKEVNAAVEVALFDFVVCGHKLTLRTAIANLLSNALKFRRPDVPPKVYVHAEVRGEYVRLWVEDNGIGVAPEHQHQIFGVFNRLHKMGEYPGTGVGLAIVQKGIERMSGRVGLESEEGKGSRFWIDLERPHDEAAK